MDQVDCGTRHNRTSFKSIAFWMKVIAAVGAGMLLAFAFPPMEWSEFAWIAFVPLISIARYSTPRDSFKWGFVSGLVFWLSSVSWLIRLVSAGGPFMVVIFGWVALSAYCSLYTGAFLAVISMLFRNGQNNGYSKWKNFILLPAIPLVWVGFEYLRSILFTGFPWNTLGISQFRNLAVIQIAEWGGVYAVSAVVMLMNTALALTAFTFVPQKGRRKTRVHFELMIGLLLCFACWTHGKRIIHDMDSDDENARYIKVAAIQPNIEQTLKWDDEFTMRIYQELELLTELALMQGPDLIVWPETAVPYAVNSDAQTHDFVKELARKGSPLLVGSMETLEFEGNSEYYNSSFLFDISGEMTGTYRKQHLVLFGEYVPFDKMVPWLQRFVPIGVSCSAGEDNTVFNLKIGPDKTALFSVLICFEDIMASLARKAVKNGAGLLVNQTNDAWFDRSSSSVQHMSHCVFRCVENRVSAVRCANTGVTCFIDNKGRIDVITQDMLNNNETHLARCRVENIRLRSTNEKLTFYGKYGDIPFALPCGIVAILCGIVTILKSRKMTE